MSKEQKQSTVIIKFPFIQTFSDYHEIEELQWTLREITREPNIYAEEYDFMSRNHYIGVFYLKGSEPSEKEVEQLLFKQNLFTPCQLKTLKEDYAKS
jgi:hypothetical protein